MASRLSNLPLFVVLVALAAVAMLLPALHATLVGDDSTARAFLYSALMLSVPVVVLSIATSSYRIRRQGRSHLISVFCAFAVLPILLAIPMVEAVPDTAFVSAYTEMVSSLTTTGLTLFESKRLPDSVHLWRAFVGWLGGFLIWVTALAIMAPLNLGGFEVASLDEVGAGAVVGSTPAHHIVDPSERVLRHAVRLAPIYTGLTVVLWIALLIAGETALVAACHAMSTLATSGISPLGQGAAPVTGFTGEALILVFFVFGLSRLTFLVDERAYGFQSVLRDPELRLGIGIIAIVTGVLFLRHWAIVLEDGAPGAPIDALNAIWGALFTVASYLTTTGFESAAWGRALDWSGYGSPGVLLLGLAVFGGGVATTAGGVKLLRVFALYKHGTREMEKLVQPSSIGSAGQWERRFRRRGAFIAWVFFMLFAVSIAVVVCALSLTAGVNFEEAVVMAIAALSNTGPLTQIAGDDAFSLDQLSSTAKGILNAAMILGRLETLAIIALLNPEFWR